MQTQMHTELVYTHAQMHTELVTTIYYANSLATVSFLSIHVSDVHVHATLQQ